MITGEQIRRTGFQAVAAGLLLTVIGYSGRGTARQAFDAATLASLYPDHDAFVAGYRKSLKHAVRQGFLLRPDAKLILTWAKGASIPP